MSVGAFKMGGITGKAVRDLSAPCARAFSAENFLWSYAWACMLLIVPCSTCECGTAEAWIKEHSQASPPVCLCFVLRPGSGTVDVCMFLVHLFDGKRTFLLSDSDVGSAAWLPVLLE